MAEQNRSEQTNYETATHRIEAQRNQLVFIRSSLFFGAGALLITLLVIQHLLWRFTGFSSQAWVALALLCSGLIMLWPYYRRHRTITSTDRMLIIVWLYALAICSYTGFYVNQEANSGTYPIFGFITMGCAIATAVTAEIYRKESANRSQIKGSLVILTTIAFAGTFLSAWIFITARDGQGAASFILSLVAIILLLFGTGAVVHHNQRQRDV